MLKLKLVMGIDWFWVKCGFFFVLFDNGIVNLYFLFYGCEL